MSVGEALVEARNRAGLSVEEVSARSLIRETVIASMEQDNYDACGGAMYVNGYIRAVAAAIGLDPQPLIEEYTATQRPSGSLPDPNPPADADVPEPGAPESAVSEPAVLEPGVAEPGVAEPGVAEPVSEPPWDREPGSVPPWEAEPESELPWDREPASVPPWEAEPPSEPPLIASMAHPHGPDREDGPSSWSAADEAEAEATEVAEEAVVAEVPWGAGAGTGAEAGTDTEESEFTLDEFFPASAEPEPRPVPVPEPRPGPWTLSRDNPAMGENARPERPAIREKPRPREQLYRPEPPRQPRTRERRRLVWAGALTVMLLAVVGFTARELVAQSNHAQHSRALAANSTAGGATGKTTSQTATKAGKTAGKTSGATAGSTPTARPTQSSTPAPSPRVVTLTPVGVEAFGPGGAADGDNPGIAGRAIDDNPTTAWMTNWYLTPHFGLLKPGTGLLIDLGRTHTITRVEFKLGSYYGATLQVKTGTDPASLTTAATASDAGGLVTMRLEGPRTARYVLLWFTELPPDGAGTYEASVYGVNIEGYRST